MTQKHKSSYSFNIRTLVLLATGVLCTHMACSVLIDDMNYSMKRDKELVNHEIAK
jgi:hypothetical protein